MLKVIISLLVTFKIFANCTELHSKGYYDSQLKKIIKKNIFIINDKIVLSYNKPCKQFKKLDLYIFPSLIDSHAHVLFAQTKNDKNFNNALIRENKLDDEARIERAKILLKEYISHGFTTIYDLGNSKRYLDAKLSMAIAGNYNFPEMYYSGPGLAVEKAQFDDNTPKDIIESEYDIITKENVSSILNDHIKNKAKILKLYLDNDPGKGKMNEELIKQILNFEKINYFNKITYHSIVEPDWNLVQNNNINSFEHANYNDIKSTNETFVTITDVDKPFLESYDYFWEPRYKLHLDRLKKLSQKKNITLLFGPDYYFQNDNDPKNRIKAVLSSIDFFKQAGVENFKIIDSMTINPAKSMKIAHKIGNIRNNSYANLIGLKKNPLLNIQHLKEVVFVMNRGRIIKEIN